MQRSKGDQTAQFVEELIGDPFRCAVIRVAVYQSMTNGVGMRKLQPLQLGGKRAQRCKPRGNLGHGLLDFLARGANPKASDLLIVELGLSLREQKLLLITNSVEREFERRRAAVQT